MEDLLPWLRSYDGVTEENCPNVDSLRDGIVFGLIFNQLQDTKLDVSKFTPFTKSENWVANMRNLQALGKAAKPIFEQFKCPLTISFSAIARGSSPDALLSLAESFLRFALKGPAKDKEAARMKGLPNPVRVAIRSILGKAPGAGAARTSSDEAPPARDNSELIQKAEALRTRLQEENAALQQQKQHLLELKQQTSRRKELEGIEKKRQIQLQRGAELDAEIQRKEGVHEEKKRLQAEIDTLRAKVAELQQRANQSRPTTIDDFRETTDEKALKLLADIDEAVKKVTPEFAENLRAVNANLKKVLQKLVQEERELREIVGDQPDIGSDDVTAKLSEDIERLTQQNNQMNEETMRLIARAEAIEKMKNKQSFLEQLRSSTRFLKSG